MSVKSGRITVVRKVYDSLPVAFAKLSSLMPSGAVPEVLEHRSACLTVSVVWGAGCPNVEEFCAS